MRALLDTNIYISYLLTPQHTGAVQAIFAALGRNQFTLLLPEEVVDEIPDVISNRPHLMGRVGSDKLTTFLELLRTVAEEIPRIEQTIPAIARDAKDDYLLTYAAIGQADYLVTGDKDLLVLEEIAGVKIVSTVAFADLLSAATS
ncbi:MAG TPA: putative toxin-antitoxin system toxin component, PIN family [Promineifilum sp.]|nr:putative toxin-antitoxin system toxin component, PIN family [Promineifilum sp.]HRQ14953.1 putative toxin-antitoxin system toxin component, PIN family [Promineifilum sp.]